MANPQDPSVTFAAAIEAGWKLARRQGLTPEQGLRTLAQGVGYAIGNAAPDVTSLDQIVAVANGVVAETAVEAFMKRASQPAQGRA